MQALALGMTQVRAGPGQCRAHGAQIIFWIREPSPEGLGSRLAAGPPGLSSMGTLQCHFFLHSEGSRGRRAPSWRLFRDQADRSQQSRRHRLDLVQILHLKAVSVFCDQRLVVVRRQGCPRIHSGVVNLDHEMVLSLVQSSTYGQPVGRMP